MKIAILGGGFTGLTAAYYLQKKGYSVTLFEKELILGGLASGFKSDNWDWSLERTYHHLFHSDADILNFANEIGFNDIFFQEPETSSLYQTFNNLNSGPIKISEDFQGKQARMTSFWGAERLQNQRNPTFYRIIPVDTPQDFLKFPFLTFPEKIRAAMILAFLKVSPYFSFYEKQTAKDFLKKTMGNNVWNVLWQELFRKKFGKYTENIVAAFIWARINKRTKKLGYVKGGFQSFINYLEGVNLALGVSIKKEHTITDISKTRNRFTLTCSVRSYNARKEDFDCVISTLPTPALTKITSNVFPQTYIQRLRKLRYLHAISLILEADKPFIEKTYWLNICTPKLPLMIVAQHTNFIDRQYYGNNHIAYIGWYVDSKSQLLTVNQKGMIDFVLPHLRKISPAWAGQISNSFLFKSPFAQPVFDKGFVKNKPDFETPIKNFYIANLDMTYPYDRGTNYAVKLGREVSKLL